MFGRLLDVFVDDAGTGVFLVQCGGMASSLTRQNKRRNAAGMSERAVRGDSDGRTRAPRTMLIRTVGAALFRSCVNGEAKMYRPDGANAALRGRT